MAQLKSRTLASGTGANGLPIATTTIYTSSGQNRRQINELRIFNNNVTDELVELFLLPYGAGAPVKISQHVLDANGGWGKVLRDMPIGPGDAIQARTTTAAMVDYVLNGEVE